MKKINPIVASLLALEKNLPKVNMSTTKPGVKIKLTLVK